MEFVLIPLLAIAAVTFCIYKLAELVFHIHLAFSLLMLLVGFAWLISLVLPGLFFHSAGFLGSLGISFVSALGFAWIATTYDARIQASRVLSDINASEQIRDTEQEWLLAAEAPVVGNDSSQERLMEVESPTDQAAIMTSWTAALQEIQLLPIESPPEQSDLSPQIVMEEAAPSIVPLVADRVAEKDGLEVENPVVAALAHSEVASEEFLTNDNFSGGYLTDEPPHWTESLQDNVLQEPTECEDGSEPETAVDNDMVGAVAAERPASDALEDLLEFAFLQRSRNNPVSALETFRLIKHLYLESDALPMVVAEIVSTLQSQGDYDGAAKELSEILLKPDIRNQGHLVQAFEQKLAELLAETGGPG